MSFSSGDGFESDESHQQLLIVTVVSCVAAILLLVCFLVFSGLLWRYWKRSAPPPAAEEESDGNKGGSGRENEQKQEGEGEGGVQIKTGTLLLPRQNGRREWLNPILSVSSRRGGLGKVSRQELAHLPPKQRLKKMEFSHSKICLLGEMNETNFGKVYRGEASKLSEGEESTTVLVKSLRELADPMLSQDFYVEMVWASGFDHPNILHLLAVCIKEEPKYMIYEYLEFGSLTVFLQSTALVWLEMDLESHASMGSFVDGDANHTQLVGIEELVAIAAQIADALAYISCKRIVLKDIGTRNCQVGKGLKVKIADFGLSYDCRSDEYCRVGNRGSRPAPLRWLAPEALSRGSYSTFSDIWSYGVLLWEVFSLGEQPYGHITTAQAAECILKHQTLEKPKHCPEVIFRAMENCWMIEPEERKTFNMLKEELSECLAKLEEMDTTSKRVSILKPSTPDLLEKSQSTEN